MARTRASAKQAGTRMETEVSAWLAKHVDKRIERRTLTGAKDRGDIAGVYLPEAIGGGRTVVEVKDYGGQLKVGPWLQEAEVERVNDKAVAGLVVAKRRGKGDPADQIVLMTLRDLATLLTGRRPEEN